MGANLDVQYWIGLIGGILTIIGVIARAVFWAGRTYLQPIVKGMDALTQSMNELKEALQIQLERLHALELHLQNVEDRCKSNQHRIEKLEKQMAEVRK